MQTTMSDVCEATARLIDDHLKRNGSLIRDPPWVIRRSKLGGRGLFAARDIEAGEIVFVDHPLIIGPRSCTENICVSCYNNKNLRLCSKNCGLYVCCENCEESKTHQLECRKIASWTNENTEINANILKCLTPIRALFLNNSEVQLLKCLAAHNDTYHGLEVKILKTELKFNIEDCEEDLMRLACEVLDANAYEVLMFEEVSTLRGLYPVSGLMNHSCTPNTMHVFNVEKRMIVRATVNIRKNDEILTTYSRLIWGTMTRRFHLLRTKHFSCGCERCKDPKECGTLMNAVLCGKCDNGVVLPKDPLKIKSDWTCENCEDVVSQSTIGFMTIALAKRLTTLDEDDVNNVLRFYDAKISKIVPPESQISLELKYRVVWLLGSKKGRLLSELSEELLDTKEKFCNDILEVLEKLGVGSCKMRGLLLFEIVKCHREKTRRKSSTEMNNNEVLSVDTDKVLNEAADIFKFDVAAPQEIKALWEKNGTKTDWRDYVALKIA